LPLAARRGCRSPRRGAILAGKQKTMSFLQSNLLDCKNDIVFAYQFCRSPRRGANSIRRIGVSENDIIFPILKELKVLDCKK
jgi:hypothetical protein